MAVRSALLEYSGRPDQVTIDLLLKGLKEQTQFKSLDKVTRGRVYAIIVECLENIVNHSETTRDQGKLKPPFITALNAGGRILIRTGNVVTKERKNRLEKGLALINDLDNKDLLLLYDHRINSDPVPAMNGTGLGLMLMKMKSGNKIGFNFTPLRNNLFYYELEISVKDSHMKKLIIDPTNNSPGVTFDPEDNVYRIIGESRPPDVPGFYGNILKWLDDYSAWMLRNEKGNEPVSFHLDFEYFNSSSAKYILDFCKKIAQMRTRGSNINVTWHYENDDTDMLEAGREMSKMARFPFEFRVKTP